MDTDKSNIKASTLFNNKEPNHGTNTDKADSAEVEVAIMGGGTDKKLLKNKRNHSEQAIQAEQAQKADITALSLLNLTLRPVAEDRQEAAQRLQQGEREQGASQDGRKEGGMDGAVLADKRSKQTKEK